MIVVDASVAIAWSLADEQDEYAEAILDLVAAQGAVAPAHWPIEVANGLLVAERRGRITEDEAVRIAAMLTGLPLEVVPVELSVAMWSVSDTAREFSLTAYDAAYLDLARVRGVALATLDGPLRAAAASAGVPLA